MNENNQYNNTEQIFTSNIQNRTSIGNSNKIDSDNFVDQYRVLRQQQKDFLLKINMSAKLKRQIFVFTDLKQHRKPDQNEKLVTLIDPFKGRLIMKNSAWQQIRKQRLKERLDVQKQMQIRYEQELIQKSKREHQEKRKSKLSQSKNEEDQNSDQKDKNADNFFGKLLKKFSKQKQNNAKEVSKSKQKQKNVMLQQIQQEQNSVPQYHKPKVQIKQKKKEQKAYTSKNDETSRNQYNINIHAQQQSPNTLHKSSKKQMNKQTEPAIFEQILKSSQNKNQSARQPQLDQDDIYQKISQIAKRQSSQNYPSQNSHKQQSVEHMLTRGTKKREQIL